MDNTSLDAALGALAQTLRSASAAIPAGVVEVDLGLVADTSGGRVRWDLAPEGAPAVHRIRFTLAVGDDARGAAAATQTGGTGLGSRDVSEIASLDPDLDLPPIIRPRPGVQEDDDDR